MNRHKGNTVVEKEIYVCWSHSEPRPEKRNFDRRLPKEPENADRCVTILSGRVYLLL
jgi:hypothetical protein